MNWTAAEPPWVVFGADELNVHVNRYAVVWAAPVGAHVPNPVAKLVVVDAKFNSVLLNNVEVTENPVHELVVPPVPASINTVSDASAAFVVESLWPYNFTDAANVPL